MSSENRPKDFFAKQIRSSHLIASGGIINPSSSDWDEDFANLRLMIYPKDALEIPSAFPGVPPAYIDGAFEGIVPPQLLEDTGGTGLKVGDDVWLFISGSQNTHGLDHDESGTVDVDEQEKRANSGVVLFGGDVVISGTLYAEKQVIEVDLSQEGELFVSGNLKVQDYDPDINFVQFMMPFSGYPKNFQRTVLSFVDPDGIADIDVAMIKDASGVGNYDLTKWSGFDVTGTFIKSELNDTLENYRDQVIDLGIGKANAALTSFQATITLLESIHVDEQDPTVASIQTLYNTTEAFISSLSSGSTTSQKSTALNSTLDGLSQIYAQIILLINHVTGLVDGGTGETPQGTTTADLTSWQAAIDENMELNIGGSTATDISDYIAAYSNAPISATLYKNDDNIANAEPSMAFIVENPSFNPEQTGDPNQELTIFNVDSLNGRVGILNVAPDAAMDVRSGYGEGNIPTAHTDHKVWDKNAGALVDVVLNLQNDDGSISPQTAGESIFWHASTEDEDNLSWSHVNATAAPEVLKIIGLKEDITNYDVHDLEPKVLTITDDGYVRFKEGGLGGAKLKEDRDGREDIGDLDTNESTLAADGVTEIWGDDYDPGNPGESVAGNPYDNGYYVDRWHGDTLVGHALDDVNKALKVIDENKAWQWPDDDAIEGGDRVILRDATNMVGIGTEAPMQKLHVHAGDSLSTAVRIDSDHYTNGALTNPSATTKLELSFDDQVHGTLSQQVRAGFDSQPGTDLLLQNHTSTGGIYLSTFQVDDAGNNVAISPIAIDSNTSNLATETQVLILSGTTGEDASGLNPRLFQDTNFFVSGSIGSCVEPLDQDGNSLQPGNGERGTAVFGGDVYVSGSIFGPNGVVGSGGGWMTALNGVCMDVFTESAYGEEGTMPASANRFLVGTRLIDSSDFGGTLITPEDENDDFSRVYFGFYSTENGVAGNDIVVNMVFDTPTASLDPISISWDDSSVPKTLDIVIAYKDGTDNDGDANNNPRIDLQRVINAVNDGTPAWPVRARIYNTWLSQNVTAADLTTIQDIHIPTSTQTWTLSGGGDSYRYVSWGGDATSGYSPSEGMADGTGDTFTRQDWAQGLVIPFSCTIVGYSVRYMSKDPFQMAAPGVNPTGDEEVIWQIGTLNEGTDPAPGASYTGTATVAKVFTPYVLEGGGEISWIKWTSADDGGYPIKWIGEGDDSDATHADELNISVTAGQTLAVRVVEHDCDVYSDYRAEASVTLWLAGGGSISLGSGGVNGGGNNVDPGLQEDEIRSYTVIDTSTGVVQVNPYSFNEYKIQLSSTSLTNYISVDHAEGDKSYLELPDAVANAGSTFVIKDSNGVSARDNTEIRIAPIDGQMIDQFMAWGPDQGGGQLTFNTDPVDGSIVEPLKIEQSFASITVWSDGNKWLIS